MEGNSKNILPAKQGVLIAGKDGHIVSADETACQLLNYRTEDLYGQSLWTLIGYHPRPSGNAILTHSIEVSARQNPGEKLTCLISLTSVLLDQQQVFVCSIRVRQEESDDRVAFLGQVVSTLQQAKEAMQLSLDKEKEVSQLKSRFVSLASHEFRTPLSSIQLSAALVERYYDRIDRNAVFRHLKKIRMAVGDLTEMLEDFLCLEKMNCGGVEPRYEEFELPKLCQEMAAEMQLQAKPGQDIRYHHEGDRASLLLDKRLLRHCLINLIINAIKYSPENSAIDLTTRFKGNDCEISIADHGMGIPAADQADLFEPFFRAHNVMAIQGTGLGLNIVKRYTQLMHGQVSFESKELQGSTFNLTFPAY